MSLFPARQMILPMLALTVLAGACGGALTGTTVPPTTIPPPAATAPADDRIAGEGGLVAVHYVGTLDDGEQFDSSRDRGQPLEFVIGSGQMISGFDAAVRGMAVGDITTVRIAPEDAYGLRDPSLLVEVDKSQVPEGISVGDTLFTASGQQVVVAEIRDDVVVIDANHVLAGEFLTFEIELVGIAG